MAFTRFSSDKDVIQKRLCEATFSGIYQLNTPGNGLNMPYIDDTHIRLQKWGANLQARSFNVEIKLPSNSRYRPNMLSILKIIDYQNLKALVVPVNAIQKAENGDYLFVVEAGKANRVNVQVGKISEGQAEII